VTAPARRRDRARDLVQERQGASHRRDLAPVVAVQSLGAAASFGVVALLARMASPEVQGEFAVYKSLVDVQVAILTLGLPSGFIYVINKGHYSTRSLLRLASGYVPVIFLMSALLTSAYLVNRGDALPGAPTPTIALIVVAAGATTYWALVRGIVLTLSDRMAFAWVTALWPIVLMTVTLVGVGSGAWSLPTSFAVSALVSVGTVLVVLRAVGVPPESPMTTDRRSALRILISQSGHTLVQAVFLSGTTFTVLWLMQHLGAEVNDLGQFSVAALAVVGPNLVVGMVAPILYSRWSRSMSLAQRRGIIRTALRLASLLQVGAIVALPLVIPGITFLLGSEYRPGAVAMCIVFLAVLPVATTRVISPALQATGSTAVVTAAWGARLLTPIALVPLHGVLDDVVLWAAAAMVAGEYAAMAVMLVLSRLHVPRAAPHEI
jgi:O-antigen/teichoic acid export membrane protein